MKFREGLEFKDELLQKEMDGEINVEVVFSCPFCNRPAGWDEIHKAEAHTKNCLYNNKNNRCVMCKHLKIIQEAQYPKNNKLWKSVDTEWAFGSFNQPYCMKKDIKLDEVEVHTYHEDCFELGEELPVIENTEEYDKWWELSTQLDKEWRTVPEEE